MKMIKSIKEIENHPLLHKAVSLSKWVNNTMSGRVCCVKKVCFLYVLKEMLGEDCKGYLEIGVLHGGSLCLVMQSKYSCAYCGVGTFDYYGNPNDGKHSVSLEKATKNVEQFNSNDYICQLIQGNSTSKETIAAVFDFLSEVSILFIDGDHSESGVVKDFENYSALVAQGGFLVFDDYEEPNWPGVKLAVDRCDLSEYNILGMPGGSLKAKMLICQKRVPMGIG